MVLFSANVAPAQDAKVFYKESFTKGVVPDGWKNVDLSGQGCAWIVTNQPYPGSFEYQQQAPPIASGSRGYYLQYQAGYFVDEDQAGWEKKGWYPDAWMQTGAIDCSNKASVILRFQQTFRYNDHHPEAGAGLFVGVSTDSVHWHDIDVRQGAPAATDMFSPLTEEENISAWAAHQPRVYLRFYWKGFYSWYWMIDDIELSEGYGKDVSVVRLLSQNEESNVFGKQDSIRLLIRNTGTQDIDNAFDASFTLDGGRPVKVIVPADKNNVFAAGTEKEISFGTADLSGSPVHNLEFHLDLPGDERPKNDVLRMRINSVSTSLGNINSFEKTSNGCIIRSGISTVRVIFYTKNIFRIWLAPDGNFTDPAGTDIVDHLPDEHPAMAIENGGSYYKINTSSCVLRIYKSPLRFALYDYRNDKMIWEEGKPIAFGAHTVQTLKRQQDEYYFGCGMQNGYFSHRDKTVLIEKGNGWDDGGRPNPSPFYMSTEGYGVLRNTFDAGKYTFKDPVTLAQNENRFDAFYFYGPSLKAVLDEYTQLSGRPFLLPRWALGMGDSNCYNKPDRDHQPQSTPVVITKVADEYIAHHMPRGWILPNDGYGCGYVKLDSVIKELSVRGFHTGLWTENGVQRIATEVGQYGSRLCKLDVAWVGPGYKFALDACKSAYEGIENNSDARGFVWSVMGWAGTQKYSTVWSGDQSGGWEYIRFHIPTITGAGLSAMNAASSDIDGIFRGSDSTYTRDLQWKCFIPVLMAMSGWAPKDKQPWVYGEPYTSINRKYLDLKMRMTPYMYTLCADAHETGVPATRATVLEFPDDSVTWSTSTQYEFMNGPSLLVAPVYKSGGERDSIYLPAGATWYDYWSGKAINGGQWLRHYPAPLDKLPLFIRSGAIIPMYPYMDYDGQRRADTVTLEVYPSGHTSFNLYEDDGSTRAYKQGGYARTLIESIASSKREKLIIHKSKGEYPDKYSQRVYVLHMRISAAPRNVLLNGASPHFEISREDWDHATEGCYYDIKEHGGTLLIKTGFVPTQEDQEWEVELQ